jgi:hypothetical protein
MAVELEQDFEPLPISLSAEKGRALEPGPASVITSLQRGPGNLAVARLLGRLAVGQSLDPATRGFMESRFGRQLGGVRVHTGPEAAASARALGAAAFTIGRHIAFANGRYRPDRPEGQRLIAHEIAHVVQQEGASPGLVRADAGIEAERDAETAADKVTAGQRPDVVPHRKLAIARKDGSPEAVPSASPAHAAPTPAPTTLKPSELPGFSQGAYVTCGAASVVSALLIWDREKRDPTAGNPLLVAACDITLVYLDDHKEQLIKTWDGADPGKPGKGIYDLIFERITQIRDKARKPGATISESEYQELGGALYLLYQGGGVGLPRWALASLLSMLGLAGQASSTVASFDDIFSKLQNLDQGRIAQVTWYVVRGTNPKGEAQLGLHAFLIGRFKERPTWFLSDQGTSPPIELEAPDLPSLKLRAAETKRYWMGAPPHQYFFGQQVPVEPETTYVRVLGERTGVTEQAKSLALAKGDFLAEVDAGILTSGSRILAGDFVTRTYAEADGQVALLSLGAGRGGVMVENPRGLFHVYETTTVSDDNLFVTEIDESDSVSGRLDRTHHQFYSAWLRLSTASRSNPKLLKVY